ncbi:uncharacterized protein LOC128322660 isoform X1 [Hemicordylus capensis]|uniref:uncharacterized protein LOC128322660 isoform X1 n=1 Tax=Hemicordylus capensis TaxID=884348 RepID=UPI00230394DB|nr:uncharacterized protein LOC128322660 isoform X1 [Hemicordylus capensis]
MTFLGKSPMRQPWCQDSFQDFVNPLTFWGKSSMKQHQCQDLFQLLMALLHVSAPLGLVHYHLLPRWKLAPSHPPPLPSFLLHPSSPPPPSPRPLELELRNVKETLQSLMDLQFHQLNDRQRHLRICQGCLQNLKALRGELRRLQSRLTRVEATIGILVPPRELEVEEEKEEDKNQTVLHP